MYYFVEHTGKSQVDILFERVRMHTQTLPGESFREQWEYCQIVSYG